MTSSVGSGSSSHGFWLALSLPSQVLRQFLVHAMSATAVPYSEGEGKLLASSSVELEQLEPCVSMASSWVVLSQVLSCRRDERFPFEGNSSLWVLVGE